MAAPHRRRAGAQALLVAAARHQASELARLPGVLASLAGSFAGTVSGLRERLPDLAATGLSSAPRTPLNVAITGERSIASVEVGLEQAKRVARRDEATINDVILAACAGALRRWLLLHDVLPDAPLRAAVPFSTREPGNTDQTIQVSFMAIDLHTQVSDPHARLRAIHVSALEAKAAASRIKAMMPEDLPSIGLPWLAGSLDALVRAFAAAVERQDSASFPGLSLTRAEFAWLYYPFIPEEAPPYELEPGQMWFMIETNSGRGLRSLLTERGGQPLGVIGHTCEGERQFGELTLWGPCTVRRLEPPGDTVTEVLFGPVASRNGRFKFVSYANKF